MAITTIDGAIAGMKPPVDFAKNVTGTMVAGRAWSTFLLAGCPGAATMPANIAITSSSVASPTNILSAAHGLSNGDIVSIQGHTGSTPAIDGNWVVTVVNATNFTIPVEVTVGGTLGVANCINKGGTGVAGTTGQALTSFTGQLPFTNPTSGSTYLARFEGQATIAGTLMLCDRLWHNCGISSTKITEQEFTDSVQIPARDANGTNNGEGVLCGVEVSSALGAGTPTITIKYTNQAGATGHTATNTVAVVASSAAGSFYTIGLQAGDTGIRRVESLTLSATATSGQMNVVLYRVLARLELTAANVPNAIDALTSGFPKMYDNTVPFLIFIPSTTTTSNITGHYIYTQG